MAISISRPPSSGKNVIGFDAINDRFNEVHIREGEVVDYDIRVHELTKAELSSAHVLPDIINQTGVLSDYPYYLDLHRHLGRIWQPFDDPESPPFNHEYGQIVVGGPGLAGVVKLFVEQYGDFFTFDVRKQYREKTTEDWRTEWREIGQASLNPSLFSDEYINDKLAVFTNPALERNQAGSSASLVLRPLSWAGWCWGLIARDKYDRITYKRCENPRSCIREIPSLPPFGKSGRKQRFCSNRCKMAERAHRQKIKENAKTDILKVIKNRQSANPIVEAIKNSDSLGTEDSIDMENLNNQ